MSERITRKHVESAFGRLAELKHWRTGASQCTPEWNGSYFLSAWSPGDGATRYNVMRGCGTSGEDFGLCACGWFGAAQAYECLWTAIRALEVPNGDAK